MGGNLIRELFDVLRARQGHKNPCFHLGFIIHELSSAAAVIDVNLIVPKVMN